MLVFNFEPSTFRVGIGIEVLLSNINRTGLLMRGGFIEGGFLSYITAGQLIRNNLTRKCLKFLSGMPVFWRSGQKNGRLEEKNAVFEAC
jgi:hypothetical protein